MQSVRRDPTSISVRESYATVLRSRIRAQLTYRSSFWINAVNSFFTGALEFVEIYVLLTNTPTLGGMTFGQATLVFGLANLGFSLADLIFGQTDQIPRYIREGKLEAFLVRPMPVLAQMITSDFQLRRVGRALLGLLVAIAMVFWLDLDLSAQNIYLLITTPIYGAAIYAALFVLAGGIQFWIIDGSEFTNAFVYGGSYAGHLPGSVLLAPLRVLFTFVFPVTVTAYLPCLLILGLDGPTFLPAWLGWFAPVFAVWSWLLAYLIWRLGVRHYTGAGG
ncbi:ABC transporter permease [Microlunatus elymi]|uniref:ABC transporter permease n=1 Tax=Microlunatus elymi TaxID=2596828 RepID=A0A516Q6I8_9ACTN|nr:ABC transporter permease [Microlunatus elymi]